MRTSETLSPFGQLLRSARLSKDLTLMQVADMVGIGFRLLGDYETGVRFPSVRRCIKLANALGISVGDIVERMEESR